MMSIKHLLQRSAATALLLLAALSNAAEPVSDEKLQQLLAPIALYPDTVLTHVLIASTYPLEIVQADRWAKQHDDLSGEEAVNRAQNEPWDPSVKALLAFPDLLARLSEDLLWSQELGEAFLADEERTLEAVQALRQQAWDNGSLQQMEHQTVVREEKQIVIQPVQREVVYVPYYDTRTVYGTWRWSAYPPVYWPQPPRYRSGFYWGVSAPVGDWFYFSGFYWPSRTVVINVNRPYYYGSHRHYGYHREYTQHWRHDHNHRRNVHYRQPWAGARDTYPQRGRNISDRQREQVTRQLRHHSSRLNALGGTSATRSPNTVKRTAAPRAQPQTSVRRHTTQTSRPATRAAGNDSRAVTNRTATSRATPRTQYQQPRTSPSTIQRQPGNSRPAYSGSPRNTIERRATPSSGGSRAAPQRQAPSTTGGNRGGRIRE
ncbi:DUF3300 domain-containing protein [uncultured Gilvimarinus sp.]|uniref:DUF3300 domain-containing protein n=1 Tax=uncultured Gilvimarinus sp. TaxID=1689143 RepID=UPI0030EDBB75